MRGERLVLSGGLLALAGLSWVYLVYLADVTSSSDPVRAMSMLQPWGPVDLIILLVMWVVMMVPSAAPAIPMFAAANRRRVPLASVVSV